VASLRVVGGFLRSLPGERRLVVRWEGKLCRRRSAQPLSRPRRSFDAGARVPTPDVPPSRPCSTPPQVPSAVKSRDWPHPCGRLHPIRALNGERTGGHGPAEKRPALSPLRWPLAAGKIPRRRRGYLRPRRGRKRPTPCLARPGRPRRRVPLRREARLRAPHPPTSRRPSTPAKRRRPAATRPSPRVAASTCIPSVNRLDAQPYPKRSPAAASGNHHHPAPEHRTPPPVRLYHPTPAQQPSLTTPPLRARLPPNRSGRAHLDSEPLLDRRAAADVRRRPPSLKRPV